MIRGEKSYGRRSEELTWNFPPRPPWLTKELPGRGRVERRRVKRDEVVKFTFVAFVLLSWCGGGKVLQFLSICTLVDCVVDFAFKGL
jgi:hypothetical protein